MFSSPTTTTAIPSWSSHWSAPLPANVQPPSSNFARLEFTLPQTFFATEDDEDEDATEDGGGDDITMTVENNEKKKRGRRKQEATTNTIITVLTRAHERRSLEEIRLESIACSQGANLLTCIQCRLVEAVFSANTKELVKLQRMLLAMRVKYQLMKHDVEKSETMVISPFWSSDELCKEHQAELFLELPELKIQATSSGAASNTLPTHPLPVPRDEYAQLMLHSAASSSSAPSFNTSSRLATSSWARLDDEVKRRLYVLPDIKRSVSNGAAGKEDGDDSSMKDEEEAEDVKAKVKLESGLDKTSSTAAAASSSTPTSSSIEPPTTKAKQKPKPNSMLKGLLISMSDKPSKMKSEDLSHQRSNGVGETTNQHQQQDHSESKSLTPLQAATRYSTHLVTHSLSTSPLESLINFPALLHYTAPHSMVEQWRYVRIPKRGGGEVEASTRTSAAATATAVKSGSSKRRRALQDDGRDELNSAHQQQQQKIVPTPHIPLLHLAMNVLNITSVLAVSNGVLNKTCKIVGNSNDNTNVNTSTQSDDITRIITQVHYTIHHLLSSSLTALTLPLTSLRYALLTKDQQGYQPIFQAVRYGEKGVVKMLIGLEEILVEEAEGMKVMKEESSRNGGDDDVEMKSDPAAASAPSTSSTYDGNLTPSDINRASVSMRLSSLVTDGMREEEELLRQAHQEVNGRKRVRKERTSVKVKKEEGVDVGEEKMDENDTPSASPPPCSSIAASASTATSANSTLHIPTLTPSQRVTLLSQRRTELQQLIQDQLSLRESITSFGLTPLLFIVYSSTTDEQCGEMLRVLIDTPQPVVNVFDTDYLNRDILHWLAIKCFPKTMKWMVEMWKEKVEEKNKKMTNGNGKLGKESKTTHAASSSPSLHDLLTSQDDYGNTPLHYVAISSLLDASTATSSSSHTCTGCTRCLTLYIQTTKCGDTTSIPHRTLLPLKHLPPYLLPTLLKLQPLFNDSSLNSLVENVLWKNEVRVAGRVVVEENVKEEMEVEGEREEERKMVDVVKTKQTADSASFSPLSVYFLALLRHWRSYIHNDVKKIAAAATSTSSSSSPPSSRSALPFLSPLVCDLVSLLPLSIFLNPQQHGDSRPLRTGSSSSTSSRRHLSSSAEEEEEYVQLVHRPERCTKAEDARKCFELLIENGMSNGLTDIRNRHEISVEQIVKQWRVKEVGEEKRKAVRQELLMKMSKMKQSVSASSTTTIQTDAVASSSNTDSSQQEYQCDFERDLQSPKIHTATSSSSAAAMASLSSSAIPNSKPTPLMPILPCLHCGSNLLNFKPSEMYHHTKEQLETICLCEKAPLFVLREEDDEKSEKIDTTATSDLIKLENGMKTHQQQNGKQLSNGIVAVRSIANQSIVADQQQSSYLLYALDGITSTSSSIDSIRPTVLSTRMRIYAPATPSTHPLQAAAALHIDTSLSANASTYRCSCTPGPCVIGSCECMKRNTLNPNEQNTCTIGTTITHSQLTPQTHECHPLCSCRCLLSGPSMSDLRRFQMKYRLQLLRTPTGYQLVTLEDIPQGAFVMVYESEVMDDDGGKEEEGQANVRGMEYGYVTPPPTTTTTTTMTRMSSTGIISTNTVAAPLSTAPPSHQTNFMIQVELRDEIADVAASGASSSSSSSFSSSSSSSSPSSSPSSSSSSSSSSRILTYDSHRIGVVASRSLRHTCYGSLTIRCLFTHHHPLSPHLALFTNRRVKRGEELTIQHDAMRCMMHQTSEGTHKHQQTEIGVRVVRG